MVTSGDKVSGSSPRENSFREQTGKFVTACHRSRSTECTDPCIACSIVEFCRFLRSLGAVPQCCTGNNQKQLAAAG